MKFWQYIRDLSLQQIDVKYIPINEIKCQYNPDRYRHWKYACSESLDIKNGPFWEYLNYKKTDKYKKLFRGYGRDEVWITKNIKAFQELVEDISQNGVKELPMVLEKPIINNPYNDSFEIFEGHRRLSICLYLGIKQEVKLFRVISHKKWAGK